MKTFNDYCREYEEAIKESVLRTPDSRYIVRRCVWILSKWEIDNKVNPWEKDKYIKALLEVERNDPELIAELSDGYEMMMNAMEKK